MSLESLILPALYHWSPVERRKEIRQHGLQPFSRPTVSTGDDGYPYVSLAPTPSAAWSLSGAMDWMEIDDWDLWQVRLQDGDEVHIRPEFDDVIREVKVHTAISPDRIWWAGERSRPGAEPIGG